MKFYFLHIASLDGSVDSQTRLNPANYRHEHIGLILDSWPNDDLFCTDRGHFFVTERLRYLLDKQFSGLKFSKIERLQKGGGFLEKYPYAELPPFYWLMEVESEAYTNDFGIFDLYEMVISQTALNFLRDNHVTHAESDEITVPLEEYFNSPRKYFWMKDERVRQYFIDMDKRKKKQVL